MAYAAAQGKKEEESWAIFNVFAAKDLAITPQTVPKKLQLVQKGYGHIIKECPPRPPRNMQHHTIASMGSSSTGGFVNMAHLTQHDPTPVQSVTLEMIQQMIIYAFSALGISGKPFSTSAPWYFDSAAPNHMTNNLNFLTNVIKYSRNLKIHTYGS